MGSFLSTLGKIGGAVLGSVGGPLVSGGLSLLGGLLGNKSDRDSVSAANAANLRLAEYQYSKNLEMWNKQNEYNKPINQMARLKEAGLNPNLVYGSGSVAGNTTSSAPEYKAPNIQAYQGNGDFGVGNAVNSVMSFMRFQNEQRQTDANVKASEAAAKNSESQALLNFEKAKSEVNLRKYRDQQRNLFDAQSLYYDRMSEDKNYWNSYAYFLYGRQLDNEREKINVLKSQVGLNRANASLASQNAYNASLFEGIKNRELAQNDRKLSIAARDVQVRYLNLIEAIRHNKSLEPAQRQQLMSIAYKANQEGFNKDLTNQMLQSAMDDKGFNMFLKSQDWQDFQKSIMFQDLLIKQRRFILDKDRLEFDKLREDNRNLWRGINTIVPWLEP